MACLSRTVKAVQQGPAGFTRPRPSKHNDIPLSSRYKHSKDIPQGPVLLLVIMISIIMITSTITISNEQKMIALLNHYAPYLIA